MLKAWLVRKARSMFSKAKAAFVFAGMAGLAALGNALMGGIVNPEALAMVALGAFGNALVVYFRKETNGYGAGVPSRVA